MDELQRSALNLLGYGVELSVAPEQKKLSGIRHYPDLAALYERRGKFSEEELSPFYETAEQLGLEETLRWYRLGRLSEKDRQQLGRELGLPESLVSRQPFPGPGLAIRVIGEVTEDKLRILRAADAIFRKELEDAGLGAAASQYFAALTNMRSVGVMGDGRSYDYAVALRAVATEDFMTADWVRLPYELLDRVSTRIVNEVPGINRVFYDITSKPPSTVEYE